MPTWVWILIAIVAIAIVSGVIWRALAARRTKVLQDQFGPEYDRTADSAGSKRRAEAELAARQDRREQLNIRPLPAEARKRYAEQWEAIQARFVDTPAGAVSAADGLVSSVMADRGYPMDDFEQRAADVSVDHPQVVQNYRQARDISRASEQGQASTEDLRQAMQNYRVLFDELLGDNAADQSLGRQSDSRRDEMRETTQRSVSR
jgi:hypothetical protein